MDRQAPGKHGGGAPTPKSPAAAVDAAEFAEYLRAERERRRLTLEQVAEETKIASRHLEALERGDVRNWPGGMYRRAMMRAYAESIGVDREFALKQFEHAFEPAKKPAAEAPVPSAEPERRAPRIPVPPLQIPRWQMPRWRPSRRQIRAASSSVLVAVALFIVWRVAGTFTSSRDDRTGNAAASAAATPAATPAATRSAVTTPAVVPAARSSVTPFPSRGQRDALASADATATTGVAEPRLRATEGTLLVASQPSGARVTVNGIGWGETPVTIRHLELGEKRVRLTMQGYVSQERVLRLGAERPNANVRLTLRERAEAAGSR